MLARDGDIDILLVFLGGVQLLQNNGNARYATVVLAHDLMVGDGEALLYKEVGGVDRVKQCLDSSLSPLPCG